MALCGLSSTLDSAYCAAGSLFSVDIYRRYLNPNARDREMLKASKFGMLLIWLVGTTVAILPGVKLLWIFMIYGTIAGSAVCPTVLSLFWPKVTAKAASWGVATALILGVPISIYANVIDSPHLLVFSSVFTALLGLVITTIATLISSPVNQHLEPIVG